MSALNVQLPEDPLERLNYFNGQRLEALDFRVEQLYHMRVRRWLNKSLYSTGIASGLEVNKHPTDKHAVVISPGLALDVDGREIILLEELTVRVRGVPRRPDGVQFGNYLVIAYTEEKAAPQQDGCQVVAMDSPNTGSDCCRGTAQAVKVDCGCGGSCGSTGSGKCGCGGGDARATQEQSWGAPSRIRSTPLISFQSAWPSDGQRKILLAQVVLNAQCQVEDVKSGMRRYATAIKPPNTTPLSIEGEKDIDKDNPKVLRFHVEGGFPDSAVLYLQASKLSSLYYTELGKHTHAITATSDKVKKDLRHRHETEAFKLKGAGAHNHVLHTESDGANSLETADADFVPTTSFIDGVDDHEHGIDEFKLNEKLDNWEHDHTLHGSAANTGATDVSARTGAARSYVNAMHVAFDGVDITAQILAQIDALNPGAWLALGDGNPTHELVANGSGAIDLRQLGVDLGPGVHTLIFSVSNGGGQISYNLYVS